MGTVLPYHFARILKVMMLPLPPETKFTYKSPIWYGSKSLQVPPVSPRIEKQFRPQEAVTEQKIDGRVWRKTSFEGTPLYGYTENERRRMELYLAPYISFLKELEGKSVLVEEFIPAWESELDASGKVGFRIPSTHHYLLFKTSKEDPAFRSNVRIIIAKKQELYLPLISIAKLKIRNRAGQTLDELVRNAAILNSQPNGR